MNDEKSVDISAHVSSGSMSLEGGDIRTITTWEYLLEHPLWMIALVTLVVLPPIIGYALGGIWTIVFGLLTGVASFYIGSKATIKVIERNRS
jgi:hypothetical protein